MHRYLLGELSEADQVALEDRCFLDPETFERMWEAENDLVDGYVRGRLVPADRERFERHYLASPVHQRRVSAARKLLAAADAQAPLVESRDEARSAWEKLSDLLGLSPVAWRYAMAAAAILLMAGGGWLLVERQRMRGELERLQAERRASEKQQQDLARQIEAQKAEQARLAEELAKIQTPSVTASPKSVPVSIFSFVLSPRSVRGGNGQELRMPAGTTRIQLKIPVEANDSRTYQAVLKTLEGKTIQRWSALKNRQGEILLPLPENRLPFDDYMLTLTANDAGGATEEVNRYAFRVIRE